MKNILICGASGHSKMVIDIVLKNKDYIIKGFIDSYKPVGHDINGFKVIGDLSAIPKLVEELDIYGLVIAIGDNSIRQRVFTSIKKTVPKLSFVPIIHPNAILAEGITIPMGTVIMGGAIINADAKIGNFCIINTKASLGHESIMGDFSSLASGATTGGNVKVGLCSAICISATVIQNISIGDNTVIGAASLVLQSIGNNKQAFGVPANIIKDRASNSKYLG